MTRRRENTRSATDERHLEHPNVKSVLVLGATGMLGHKLMQRWADRYECTGTVRVPEPAPALAELLGAERLRGGVDATEPRSVAAAIDAAGAEVVVNCIGVVKQAEAATDPVPSIRINSLFPHEVAALCRERRARLIHVSTDCVFTGSKGAYTEDDHPDAEDLYGRSKLLGETPGPSALTVRTSIIGRELHNDYGLVEWLISNRGGAVKGFERAIFSGFTTAALADQLGTLIDEGEEIEGVWHLSADPIDKNSLLGALNQALGLGIAVTPDDRVALDRSLDSSRLRAAVGLHPPSWPEMVAGMAADETPYDTIRSELARR